MKKIILFASIVSTTAFAQRSVTEVVGATAPAAPVVRPPQDVPGGLSRKMGGFETTRFPSRFVYLNGANVSSVRNQDLENVTVKIDEQGNIHILAPHYEVTHDPSYHPLLPGELPRFPKDKFEIDGLPQGRYSKDPATGQANGVNLPNQPIAPLAPRAPVENEMQPSKPEAKADIKPDLKSDVPPVPAAAPPVAPPPTSATSQQNTSTAPKPTN